MKASHSFKFKQFIKSGMRNLKSTILSNKKPLSIPIFTLLTTYLFYNQYGINFKSSKVFCLDKNRELELKNTQHKIDSKYFIYNTPQIIILYDEENELQKEMTDLIYDMLQEQYFKKIDNSNSIKIEKTSNSEKYKSLLKIDLKSANEPVVIIKNEHCVDILNPCSFLKTHHKTLYTEHTPKLPEKVFSKLNNLLTFKKITLIKELREEFRYLENPQHKIIIISPSQVEDKSLSFFRHKKTKILIIDDEQLRQNLKMENGKVYQYYTPKLPNKMKDTELFLQEHFANKFDTKPSEVVVHEYLNKEGIDLNAYLNNNSVSLMLNYQMFRDEIKLSKDLYEGLIKEKGESVDFTYEERVRMQKRICYPSRNVSQVAEADKKLIEDQFLQPEKYFLLIYLPTWTLLKENIFEYLLYESGHLFDKIQITNSKNFAFKHELYDDSQISGDLPQIYLIETASDRNNSQGVEKKAYSMNYFRFPDDFQKYLKNRKDPFQKPEVVDNHTYVKTVNSKNFEELVLKDKSFKEFLIEIKHEGCPTCYMLGKMFDHLSQKFHKHKLDTKTKFFRIDTHNDLPYLGEFAATPTYLFCRKNEKGEISFISQVEKQEFLFKIKKLSNQDLSKVRYHPNIGFGFYLFQRNEFLKSTYDPDIDLSGFAI